MKKQYKFNKRECVLLRIALQQSTIFDTKNEACKNELIELHEKLLNIEKE